jgi:hypothetical protein
MCRIDRHGLPTKVLENPLDHRRARPETTFAGYHERFMDASIA